MNTSKQKAQVRSFKTALSNRNGFPDDLPVAPPPEANSAVVLKTLMDLKEEFGCFRSDMSKLSKTVEDVKKKQDDIDKEISTIKTITKTILTIFSILSAIFAVIKYWDVIVGFVQGGGS